MPTLVNVSGSMHNCAFHSIAAHILLHDLPIPADLFERLDGADTTANALIGLFSDEARFNQHFDDLAKVRGDISALPEKSLILGVLLRQYYQKNLQHDIGIRDDLFAENPGHASFTSLFDSFNELSGVFSPQELDGFMAGDTNGVIYQAVKDDLSRLKGEIGEKSETEKAGILKDYWDELGYAKYCAEVGTLGKTMTAQNAAQAAQLLGFAVTVYDISATRGAYDEIDIDGKTAPHRTLAKAETETTAAAAAAASASASPRLQVLLDSHSGHFQYYADETLVEGTARPDFLAKVADFKAGMEYIRQQREEINGMALSAEEQASIRVGARSVSELRTEIEQALAINDMAKYMRLNRTLDSALTPATDERREQAALNTLLPGLVVELASHHTTVEHTGKSDSLIRALRHERQLIETFSAAASGGLRRRGRGADSRGEEAPKRFNDIIGALSTAKRPIKAELTSLLNDSSFYQSHFNTQISDIQRTLNDSKTWYEFFGVRCPDVPKDAKNLVDALKIEINTHRDDPFINALYKQIDGLDERRYAEKITILTSTLRLFKEIEKPIGEQNPQVMSDYQRLANSLSGQPYQPLKIIAGAMFVIIDTIATVATLATLLIIGHARHGDWRSLTLLGHWDDMVRAGPSRAAQQVLDRATKEDVDSTTETTGLLGIPL